VAIAARALAEAHGVSTSQDFELSPLLQPVGSGAEQRQHQFIPRRP
jgi:hypothetical protein